MSPAAKASRLAKLRQQYSALSVKFDLLRKNDRGVQLALDTLRISNVGAHALITMQTGVNAATEEDMIRFAAQIAALLDPSGVANTVAAYTYPKCSKLGY